LKSCCQKVSLLSGLNANLQIIGEQGQGFGGEVNKVYYLSGEEEEERVSHSKICGPSSERLCLLFKGEFRGSV
jgi:hypothetical protein